MGGGILRLLPAWVPRQFCKPGKRIKLHPDDYFALGLERGGIDERWLSSTTKADNGPGTPEDEGLSYVEGADGQKILLKDMISTLKSEILGEFLWEKYKGWPMFSKFFDNQGPLPHHIHHRDEHASKVNSIGKPETYFFPSQMNNHGGDFPFTFFGLSSDTSKEDVLNALKNFSKGDNQITALSSSYKLELDTGWDVPPGILHAPGSLCTYEPQMASDVYAMYQSVLPGGEAVPENLLWKDTPDSEKGNFDYLMEVIDWELNLDPDFRKNRYMRPVPVSNPDKMADAGFLEEWVIYKSWYISAKRLTVYPGQSVTVYDNAPYGCICIQGYGKLNQFQASSPTLIRYGESTDDEFFVSESAAKQGVKIVNESQKEEMVFLKHFGPGNPDLDLKEPVK